MNKVLLFMLVFVVSFAFVACGGPSEEEQIRINENNAVIVEIYPSVSEKFQSFSV